MNKYISDLLKTTTYAGWADLVSRGYLSVSRARCRYNPRAGVLIQSGEQYIYSSIDGAKFKFTEAFRKLGAAVFQAVLDRHRSTYGPLDDDMEEAWKILTETKIKTGDNVRDNTFVNLVSFCKAMQIPCEDSLSSGIIKISVGTKKIYITEKVKKQIAIKYGASTTIFTDIDIAKTHILSLLVPFYGTIAYSGNYNHKSIVVYSMNNLIVAVRDNELSITDWNTVLQRMD